MLLNLVLFISAQVLHIVANAFYAAQNVNTRWTSVTHYIQTNLSKLITQLVLSIGAFVVVSNNPGLLSAIGLGSIGNMLLLKGGAGVALILGWFMDSLLDKMLGFWGLKVQVAS